MGEGCGCSVIINVQGMEVGNEEGWTGMWAAPRSQGAACAGQTFPLTSQFLLLSLILPWGCAQGAVQRLRWELHPRAEGGVSCLIDGAMTNGKAGRAEGWPMGRRCGAARGQFESAGAVGKGGHGRARAVSGEGREGKGIAGWEEDTRIGSGIGGRPGPRSSAGAVATRRRASGRASTRSGRFPPSMIPAFSLQELRGSDPELPRARPAGTVGQVSHTWLGAPHPRFECCPIPAQELSLPWLGADSGMVPGTCSGQRDVSLSKRSRAAGPSSWRSW